MRKFEYEEIVRIKGRGFMFLCDKFQCPEDLWDLGVLAGETVLIGGEEFKVKGVEMFRHAISPEYPYRMSFGLLV